MSRVGVHNLPRACTEGRLRNLFSPVGEITDVRVMRTDEGEDRRFGFVGFRTEAAAQEAVNRFNRFQLGGSRIICEIAAELRGWQPADRDPPTCRLFVRNLAEATSEEELRALFSQYGRITEVYMPVDKLTGKSRCFAFVQYTNAQSASRALGELNYSTFQGRLLHVKKAKPPVQTNRRR